MTRLEDPKVSHPFVKMSIKRKVRYLVAVSPVRNDALNREDATQ